MKYHWIFVNFQQVASENIFLQFLPFAPWSKDYTFMFSVISSTQCTPVFEEKGWSHIYFSEIPWNFSKRDKDKDRSTYIIIRSTTS